MAHAHTRPRIPMTWANRRLLLAVALSVVAIAGALAWAVMRGGAESGVDSATNDVLAAAARGDQDTIVARVGDREIRRTSVTGYLAFGAIPAAMLADGTPVSALDAAAALQLLIDAKLVAVAAERSGITVSEDDVTRMVELSIVAPLRDGTLPEEMAKLFRAYLTLAGTNEDGVVQDEAARAVFRDWLLTGRYLQQTGQTREELLAAAREQIPVEIIPGVLP